MSRLLGRCHQTGSFANIMAGFSFFNMVIVANAVEMQPPQPRIWHVVFLVAQVLSASSSIVAKVLFFSRS